MMNRILVRPSPTSAYVLGLALLGLATFSLMACNDSSPSTDPVPGSRQTRTVGESGGVIEVGGLKMTIPAGALTSDTEITVEKLTTVPDKFAEWMEPTAEVYHLLPEGLTFASNIEIRLISPPSDDEIGAIWTEKGELAIVPHVREGDIMIIQGNHFSWAASATWRIVKRAFWTAKAIVVAPAELLGGTLELIGAVEVALFCKAKSKGGVNVDMRGGH